MFKQTPEQQARFAARRETSALKVAAKEQARMAALISETHAMADQLRRPTTLEEAFSDDAALTAPVSVEDFIAKMGLEGGK